MTKHLTAPDLRHLKSMLMGLRFMQAAALVAAGVAEDKKAIEYMKAISRMEKLIELELKALAQRPVQEPVYHLRQFGDVTKEQLDRYIATGDINPQPAPVRGQGR